MKNLTAQPLFGFLLSIVVFELSLLLQRRFRSPLLNPLLLSMAGIIFLLRLTGIPYEDFVLGGSLLTFFIVPATVVLAVPLYRNFELLKKNALPILVGIGAGSLVNILSVFFLSKALKIEEPLMLSLLPKSVTTAIGVELSQTLGGIPQITIAAIVVSGITGVIAGPWIFKVFKVEDPVAKGVAFGTASHALGTTKAMETGEVEGAMSGLSIGIAGLITVLLTPIILQLLQ
ncbi:LrgB family protein [Proteiniclasticum sp. BAD-10]|uniref:LrgB family protein n=1 Tax=Proteiniclasticum sediminis TaxID=2804028 RepID=A0A941HQ26_9CLOT|nr:LrgB family protein [Proteiniclasticum sediminis]MBR0575008.1 LrgB family protein [Proteiniclasticum sediminis]